MPPAMPRAEHRGGQASRLVVAGDQIRGVSLRLEGRGGRRPHGGDEHARAIASMPAAPMTSRTAVALVNATHRGAGAALICRGHRTMASGSAMRHGRDQWHHHDGCAGGVEPVDEALSLLARPGDEYAAPGERQGGSRHRRRAATVSPSASGSSMPPDASARRMAPSDDERRGEHQPSLLDPCPRAEREQAAHRRGR